MSILPTENQDVRASRWRTGIPTLDDDKLVQECLAGHWEAFDIVVRKYRDRIGSVASRLLDGTRDVEDVVQDTFIEAFHALRQYRGPGRLEWWLCRIALNNIRDRMRGSWLRRTFLMSDVDEGALENAQEQGGPASDLFGDALDRMRRAALRQAIRKLPQRLRVVVTLRFYEGYKTAEIAEIMRIPEGTVRSDLVRACSRLRKSLDPYYSNR